jgi:amino-acid N-acetyltransferase
VTFRSVPNPRTGPSYYVRPARASEGCLIRRRVWREGLDPTTLDWRRFVVAVTGDEQVVGFAQVKDLGRSVHEFGSLVVEPAWRGLGVGGTLVHALRARHGSPLYLLCGAHNVAYYRSFGFHTLPVEEMPRPLRRKWRIGNALARLVGRQVAAMGWGRLA